MEEIVAAIVNVLTALSLLAGLFFMFVGALGVVRLPDFYARSHASSKCITLGMLGLLGALVLFVGTSASAPAGESQLDAAEEMQAETGGGAAGTEAPTVAATTKALLVLAFVFVSAPVGSHMLARAAHRARVASWHGTIGDELAEDEDAAAEAARQPGDRRSSQRGSSPDEA